MPQPSHKFVFGLFTHLIVCKQKDAQGIRTERVGRKQTTNLDMHADHSLGRSALLTQLSL